jgi:uncharacterized membrane protein YfcA
LHILDSPTRMLIALAAAVVAGIANAAAGGGSNISFPVLVWLGLPPVAANTTNATALWTGSIGGAWSYRGELQRAGRAQWLGLAIPSLLGGALGAWLLVRLPSAIFGTIAPYLVLGSTLLMAAEPALRRRIAFDRTGGGRLQRAVPLFAQFVISVYGGYFGAGIGILVLATLGLLGVGDIHRANALKNLLVVAIKGVAILYFALTATLVWSVALLMMGGAFAGGWAGGFLVQKLNARTMRWVVVSIGMAMAVALLAGL